MVRFSRSRGRYERQGILVEPQALERAERECTEDADDRARVRVRAGEQRRIQDRQLASQMESRPADLFPRCPPAVIAAIRHNRTNYDELLAAGVGRADARDRVADRVRAILERWR